MSEETKGLIGALFVPAIGLIVSIVTLIDITRMKDHCVGEAVVVNVEDFNFDAPAKQKLLVKNADGHLILPCSVRDHHSTKTGEVVEIHKEISPWFRLESNPVARKKQ